MSDEDKTKKRHGRTDEEKQVYDAAVVELFGEGRAGEPPLDPDNVRPQNHKSKPRDSIRVGRRWTELLRAIDAGEVTMKEFVKAMTPEELVRGQMKASDGSFRGAPPKWIPSEFHAECMRELLKRGDTLWRESYLSAIEVYKKVAEDERVEPQHRLKAAQYIIERIAGKTPDKVEVTVAQPWETLIGGIVAEAEDEAIARATHILGAGGE